MTEVAPVQLGSDSKVAFSYGHSDCLLIILQLVGVGGMQIRCAANSGNIDGASMGAPYLGLHFIPNDLL